MAVPPTGKPVGFPARNFMTNTELTKIREDRKLSKRSLQISWA